MGFLTITHLSGFQNSFVHTPKSSFPNKIVLMEIGCGFLQFLKCEYISSTRLWIYVWELHVPQLPIFQWLIEPCNTKSSINFHSCNSLLIDATNPSFEKYLLDKKHSNMGKLHKNLLQNSE